MALQGLNPPDSPPKDARDVSNGIPEGLATKLGKFGGPLIFLLGALADATGVELDGTSEKAFYASLALLAVTMIGRYAQGYALYRDAPSPRQTLEDDDASGEPDEVPEPSEGELALADGEHPDGPYVPSEMPEGALDKESLLRHEGV